MAVRVEIGLEFGPQALRDGLSQVLSDGGRGAQSGRFDARCFKEIGRGLADNEVMAALRKMRAQPRK